MINPPQKPWVTSACPFENSTAAQHQKEFTMKRRPNVGSLCSSLNGRPPPLHTSVFHGPIPSCRPFSLISELPDYPYRKEVEKLYKLIPW